MCEKVISWEAVSSCVDGLEAVTYSPVGTLALVHVEIHAG